MSSEQTSTKFSLKGLIALILAGEAIFLLPYIVVRLFRPVMLKVFGLSNLELGLAMSAYGITAIIAYLVGGPFADKYQPRKLISMSLVITALGGIYLSTFPDVNGIRALYGFWGISTILLFWSSLIKATRIIGGKKQQGKAFGILEGGRGFLSALIATFSVSIFAIFMPANIDAVTEMERANAFQSVIQFITAFVAFIAVVVWFLLPDTELKKREEKDKIKIDAFFQLIKQPAIWLQATIIVCAYVGYKSVGDFAQYAQDVLHYNDVQSGVVVTLALWLRPVIAILAGIMADYFKKSHLMIGAFILIFLSASVFATGILTSSWIPLFMIMIVSACVGIFAMRTLYFSIMDDANIPVLYTGTAVGIASVIGYTPDIFMYPLQGYLLDNYPGILGHQLFFSVLAGFALIGLIAAIMFMNLSSRKK